MQHSNKGAFIAVLHRLYLLCCINVSQVPVNALTPSQQ
jgi:hypothetical protein